MITASARLSRLPAEERGLTIGDFLVPIRVGERMGSRLRHIALIAIGAALIFAGSRIAIPVPGSPIPVTGQTFGVLLVGGALGFRRGLASVALYVLIGLIGLPFFAEGKGGVSVIDFATRKVTANWSIPGGGSPDMGNVSADGKWLWLAARYDDVIYRFDTTSGEVAQVKVGAEPHGLTVWPQPGRYSLGHTGNMR